MTRTCSLALALAGLGLPTRPLGAAALSENFHDDPALRGWRVAGQAALFRWDAAAANLAVTWDSAQPNSYFYLPFGTFLTKDDDFVLQFDLRLDDLAIGTTPGKPAGFEIAVGFLNLEQATSPSFLRGTGIDSPNLVEWDYFPPYPGFWDATVWATMVPQDRFNFNWAYSSNERTLEEGKAYRFQLNYTAAARTLDFAMVVDGVLEPLKKAALSAAFGDFEVDALSVTSYSDAGQDDPIFGSSVLAHGSVDNITLQLPDPPVRRFTGGVAEGVWRGEFTGWTGWNYTLERSADLQNWRAVGASLAGTGRRQALVDPQPAADRGFYRVRAERL
jgi:hypothetical protein